MDKRKMKSSGVKWVGEIPDNWNIHPLYCYFDERKNKNSCLKEKNLLSLSYGKIIRKDINVNGGLLPENFSSYNVVENNDIVIRPTDLQNDKRSLRTGLVREHGIITSAYIALKPKDKQLDTRYYHYLLHSYDVIKVFYNMGNGVRQGLNFSEFSNLMVFGPSYQEQKRIADFLDYKCNEIDYLSGEIKNQVETLEKYKKTLITEVVTKGLTSDIEMKDSSVDIIKKVPSSWKKTRLKYLCSIQTGDEDTQNANPDGKYPFYVRSPIVERCDRYTFEGEGILVAGDGAGAGRIFHLVDGKYAVHQRVYRLSNFKFNTKFIHYYLSNLFPLEMDKGSAQSTVPSMRLPMLSSFVLFLPSNNEAEKIVSFLDEKCCEIDTIINTKNTQLEKLSNYKRSMVFEYVTGKKEAPSY